jgi:hypothetical protein
MQSQYPVSEAVLMGTRAMWFFARIIRFLFPWAQEGHLGDILRQKRSAREHALYDLKISARIA